ncbi:cytochrome c oxidase subunit 6b-1-like [Cynara cardunculus var. scolymus]|uniref:cytochrome c oxidase subunit 6b-1-like n=1 Tax=Cynara cardunculus var. scolymus TaxID=59895 RepID=UPI000D62FF3E|nr:cytochrome c oxidase subunit 6b-1-like [Cynara cardunculus var. scolymus]
MLVNGFTRQLKGWWDNYLTTEAKYAITHAIKVHPNQSEAMPDSVNTQFLSLYILVLYILVSRSCYHPRSESPATTDSVESSDNSAVSESVTASADSCQGSDVVAAEENVVETDNNHVKNILGDNQDPVITSDKDVPVPPPPATEESSENAEEGNIDEEKPEIKLETAPRDYRFSTTNRSRHCFTRYVEYHRCVGAKGEDASECDKFAKFYRSLCPGEWVDRWNEQRENGTFPGPL